MSKARKRKRQWLGCAMKSSNLEVIGREENDIEIKHWDCPDCPPVSSWPLGPIRSSQNFCPKRERAAPARGIWRAMGSSAPPRPAGLCGSWAYLRATARGPAGGGAGLSPAGGAFGSRLHKADRERYSDFLLANRWCSPAGFLSSAGVCQQLEASSFVLLIPASFFWTGLN